MSDMYQPAHLPTDRSKWSREQFLEAINYNRRKAQGKRQQATNHDLKADELSKESAKFSTEKLPLFECTKKETPDIIAEGTRGFTSQS